MTRGGRGLFISFEGGEASGKSVQAQRLVRTLTARRLEVVSVREPGGTAAGERIREIVLHAREAALSPEAQALLFSAARAQLVREVIRPALSRDAVVVADRFFDSTLAYQGAGGGDAEGLRAITRFAVGETVPDVTFLLDLGVDAAMARAGRRAAERPWDRFEAEGRPFHERLREGYLRLAAAEPGRFVIVDGERAEDEVAAEIARRVDALLPTPA